MSTVTITIETGTAAFHEPTFDSWGPEIARILCVIACQFDEKGEVQAPRDINGKTVGSVVVSEESTHGQKEKPTKRATR